MTIINRFVRPLVIGAALLATCSCASLHPSLPGSSRIEGVSNAKSFRPSVRARTAQASAGPAAKPAPTAPGPAAPAKKQGALDIPVTVVVADGAYPRIRSLCKSVERLRGMESQPGVGVQKTEAAASLAGVDDAVTKAVAAAAGVTKEAKSQTEAVAAAKAVFVAVAPVRPTCERMASGATLTDTDLTLLRSVRDDTKATVERLAGLAEVLDKVEDFTKADDLAKLKDAGAVTEAGGSAGSETSLGSFQNIVLRGLGEFLVTRAKAELSVALRDRLVDEVCKEGTDGARYLPNLCAALRDLDSRVALSAIGAHLQAAAVRDLERLPELLLANVAHDKELAAAVLVAVAVYREAAAGRSPREIVWSVADAVCPPTGASQPPLIELHPKVATAVCAGARLLRALEAQPRWQDIALAAPGTGLRSLRLGIVLALEREMGVALSAAKIEAIEAALTAVIRLAHEVHLATERIAKNLDGKVGTKDYVALSSKALGLLLHAARAVCTADKTICSDGDATVLNRMLMAQELGSKLAARDVAGAAVAGTALLAELDIAIPDSVKPVLPFVTELSNAKTSEDVAKAIEAAAAPVGSYKAKYQRNVVALNAFLGAGAGLEWVRVSETTEKAGVAGVFAPVGVHATHAVGADFHIGLMLSVIDIGVLATARLEEEVSTEEAETTTVESEASIGFAQVFAPGVFVTGGLFGLPVVLGVGASVSPALRTATIKNTSTGAERESDLTAFRGIGFVAADVTILPF